MVNATTKCMRTPRLAVAAPPSKDDRPSNAEATPWNRRSGGVPAPSHAWMQAAAPSRIPTPRPPHTSARTKSGSLVGEAAAAVLMGSTGSGLADAEQFDHEDEGRVGWDGTGVALFAVGEVAGDGELGLVAHLHLRDAEIPAGNHLAGTKDELEGLVAVDGAVELLSVLERAGVMHGDEVAFLGRGAGAADEGFDLQVGGRHKGGRAFSIQGSAFRFVAIGRAACEEVRR